jgi:hypothetical protein
MLVKGVQDLIKQAVDDVLTKKYQDIQDAFNRMKIGKEAVVANVGAVADEAFKKVNALVDEYNGKRDRYAREGPNQAYFAALPRATPISPADAKRINGGWQSARNKINRESKSLGRNRNGTSAVVCSFAYG